MSTIFVDLNRDTMIASLFYPYINFEHTRADIQDIF
jgi:hypothetical protein